MVCGGQDRTGGGAQGTLAERLRAAGAGMGPFFTPTAYGTRLAQGKETRSINGRGYVLEEPLPGDVAFVKAQYGDCAGNLTYRYASRNFGPVMCMAARLTVAQVDQVVPLGALAPEQVMTLESSFNASSSVPMSINRLSRARMAQIVADDIPPASYVNLGIGMRRRWRIT